MKVVILAGGFGTRIAEANGPKPMVKIGNKPILFHIMNYYKKFGFNDFIVALGYKGNFIKKKFKKFDFNVEFVDTGINTLTGGRIKRLKKYLNDERFMLTYGDGLSNVNLKKLLQKHITSKKIATVTAVRPPARFGEVIIKSNKVVEFSEKRQSKKNWINGGFFVFEPNIFKYIKNDQTYLEREPLEIFSKKKQLMAFKHHGFWQCMDTKRDKQLIENILDK